MPTNSHDRATIGHDKQPRQATTSRVNSDDRATTSRDSDAAMSPLTVEEAAQLLEVSPRTVQRRCQSGKLSAKQTQGEFGDVWEIDRSAVEKMAAKQPRQAATESDDKPRQGHDTATTSHDNQPRKATTSDDSVAAVDAAPDEGEQPSSPDRDDAPPDFRARYIAQMEAENSFLKSQLEDANRNAAELRAALRKALEIAPRQLAAAPGDAATPTDTATAPPIAPAPDAATPGPNAAKSPATREPRPLWKVILGLR